MVLGCLPELIHIIAAFVYGFDDLFISRAGGPETTQGDGRNYPGEGREEE
jgi:hypothetical protein